METSPQRRRSDFREALVQFLWDQWVSIGVAGSARSRSIPFVIDPEALLLATTRFCREENRLMSEVLDWLQLNGKSLSLQRLKNHHYLTLVGDLPQLFGLANRLAESRQPAWRAVLKWEPEDRPVKTNPRDTSDLVLREMSRKPDTRRPEAFLFKMRSLFGVNARAEVLTWLMTHESGYPAEIARETGWFSKSIQSVLNDLEQSLMVSASASEKREKYFRLRRRAWLEFLSPDHPDLGWFNQISFYQACLHVEKILDKLASLKKPTDRMQAIAIRERLPAMVIGFEKAGAGHLFPGHRHQSGEELASMFWNGVEKVQAALSGDRGELRDSAPVNFRVGE